LFQYNPVISQETDKIAGITIVAPPNPFKKDPMPALKRISTKWVALVPYAFISQKTPEVRFGSNRQWWGERIDGIKESIKLAKTNNLKIMLKPQVWMREKWVGEMDFDTEAEWQTWEQSYSEYIMSFVDLAIEMDIDMICVGTEFKIATIKREKFWRNLISQVRTKYTGLITYSSNWDSYKNIPFWDALDFIGISAYFPLSDADTPNVYYLKYKWASVKNRLKKFSLKFSKPILFTEYGYLSVDGCANKTWELEKQRRNLKANEKAQSNALEALYSALWNESWWAGGFLWKWYPNGRAQEGEREKDYTPQGKISELTIKKWYSKAAM